MARFIAGCAPGLTGVNFGSAAAVEAISPTYPAMDHDRLFKELLTTFFAEFLQLFFPELAAYLDPDSVEFVDKELFTDVTQGDRHEADLVVRARFRGQGLCFLIHVENHNWIQPGGS